MRRVLLFALMLGFLGLQAQNTEEILPKGMTDAEQEMMKWYTPEINFSEKNITTPPDFPVRTMAEWEEIQALMIRWNWGTFNSILAQITKAAKEECEVVIVSDNNDQTQITNYLQNTWGVNMDNVSFLTTPSNSIWIRDYGANTVYANDVDSLMFVEWIYNRPRPLDDAVPLAMEDYFDAPIYSTTEPPYSLVHTGGNFHIDGMGMGFSSDLVQDENQGNCQFCPMNQSDQDILDIMQQFMGIEEYVLMPALPFDAIHHIDMHMRLLDEETLLVGEYPTGVADGPQIEANLAYILANFTTSFGNPFDVVRIQMPPEGNSFPNTNGDYRTYTNNVFVNKTLLLPTYEAQYDEPAIEILQEQLPGYTIVPINCNSIIPLSGALHCITRAVGVDDPLLVQHAKHRNTFNEDADFNINAIAKHKSGVNNVSMFWTYDTENMDWTEVPMELTDATEQIWSATIPNPTENSEVYYYFHAEANSGKTINRPMPAPEGYFNFTAEFDEISTVDLPKEAAFAPIYPNPAKAITVIPVTTNQEVAATIKVVDMLGRTIEQVFQGDMPFGENNYFIDASQYQSGTYLVYLETETGLAVQKLFVAK